jgi:peptidoglycan/xylan/chitin deacetylase (PgdA/CDA1 family)
MLSPSLTFQMPIPILMYHQIVVPPKRGHPYRGLCVAPTCFARQMRLMARLGWTGLSMNALLPYLQGKKQGRVFGITFDDAYTNVHTDALPVLQLLGFSATTYVVAGRLGGSNDWDHKLGIAPSPLMDANQLREWQAAGHEIGSHTYDHLKLNQLLPDEVRHQLVTSRQTLEDQFGQRVTGFCYPYGGWRPDLGAAVAQAGYLHATTTRHGRARLGEDHLALPRVHMTANTGVLGLLKRVYTGYEDRRGKRKQRRDALRAA